MIFRTGSTPTHARYAARTSLVAPLGEGFRSSQRIGIISRYS